MRQLTPEQAIRFSKSLAYQRMTPKQLSLMQLRQRYLCVPIGVFHQALEVAIGRPVWTHEMAYPHALLKEINAR